MSKKFNAIHRAWVQGCSIIIQWRRDHGLEFPPLSDLARKTFWILATSVASERVFSMDGHVVNSKRAKKEALKGWPKRFHTFTLVFFKSFYWLWNEPLNYLPPSMKHVAWVFSGSQRVRFLKLLRERAKDFNSHSSLTPKTVFASQIGLMYCRQKFYGPAFKMWQINITKQNITSGLLGTDPCHSGPIENASRTGTGSRLAARLLPAPESYNTATLH